MARGRRRLLRQRRRMPHGVPLPADAAVVHGPAARGSFRHHRHAGADAGHPSSQPVGHLPAQPRRADAGDGDGRRARRHVPRLRPRPAGAHQSRDSPAAGAAAGEPSRQDRTAEWPAAVAARHAGALLRRRDRHGRQHLPGRPQRRPHAHAVEPQTATPASRGPTRSSCILPVVIDPDYHYECGQRRGAAAQPAFAVVVDEATGWHCGSAIRAFGRGSIEFLLPDNPKVLAFLPPLSGGVPAGGGEPVALPAIRGAGPGSVPGHDTRRSDRSNALSRRRLGARID